jgi:hypothetical protein
MTEATEFPVFSIFTLRLRHERHVVHARQRAREIAALLGFEHQEQIRIATAASELARNAFRSFSSSRSPTPGRGFRISPTFLTADTSPAPGWAKAS